MTELQELRLMIERLVCDVHQLRQEIAGQKMQQSRWTVKEVCAYGHCGRTFVMEALKAGKIPGAVKEGRKWLFDPQEVMRFFGHTTST